MYQAIITPLTNVRPHWNAEKLQLATVANSQVVVGLDNYEGQRGAFFPCDGRLSHEMLVANKLYRKHPETNEEMGGFFDVNGRVRALKLRQEISDGYWTPLESLQWTGVNIDKLKDNTQFTILNKKEVCSKYISPATMKALFDKTNNKTRESAKRKLKLKEQFSSFKEHFNTNHLAQNMHKAMTPNTIIYITEKVHGTSGRTGYIKSKNNLTWFQRLWNRVFKPFQEYSYRFVSGTRRTIIDPELESFGSLKHKEEYNKSYRNVIHQSFTKLPLRKGETFYYEIAGFRETGAAIMSSHNVVDKKLIKKYGKKMPYKYGCEPNTWKVFIYRITIQTEDGYIIELPWTQVLRRCKELQLEPVITLATLFFETTLNNNLLQTCNDLKEGESSHDSDHIREGVCVRCENEDGTHVYKHKSFHFLEMEGNQKDSDTYVDTEELEDLQT